MKKIRLFINSSLENRIIFNQILNDNFVYEVIEVPNNRSKLELLKLLKKTGLKFFFFHFFVNIYFKFFYNLKKNVNLNTKYSKFRYIDGDLSTYIKRRKFDIVINSQPNLLKGTFLKDCGVKFINCHSAPLPEFKGPANYIWLFLYAKKCNGTFHYLNEKIDSGDIIFETKKMNIKKFKTIFHLWFTIRLEMNKCILRNIKTLKFKKLKIIKKNSKSKIRSFPNKHDIYKIKRPFFSLKEFFLILRYPFL